MSPIRLNGSTSGFTELSAPAVAGNNSIALPTGNGSAYQILRNGATAGSLEYTDKIVSGTAVASTSGTSIDFTGIPSWVKRVTVMFNGVKTSGASFKTVQIGSGSIVTTGYVSDAGSLASGAGSGASQRTDGFHLYSNAGTHFVYGSMVLTLLSGSTWVASHACGYATTITGSGGGSIALGGTLDRVRITTVSPGTDTFDAGSINILYE